VAIPVSPVTPGNGRHGGIDDARRTIKRRFHESGQGRRGHQQRAFRHRATRFPLVRLHRTRNGAGKPVTGLWLSLPPGRGRWTGRRLALASAAVCCSPEAAWHACPQDLPSSVAAGALPNPLLRYGHDVL
jgi:hypothetical protein